MAPVIAAVAKVVTAIVAKVTFAAVAKFIVTTALSIGISKLMAKRAMSNALAGGEGGGRVQLPPATDNKIPVVYGTAFIGGSIIDAMLSTDQKTMWYVVALAEHTDTTVGSGYTYGDIYYDGKLVEFGSNGAVTSLITNNANPLTAQKDTRVNGYLNIYLYSNGSANPTNSSFTAQQVLSTINGVPSGQEWDANDAMTNCAFAIVKVKYSTDAGTTGVGALTAQITNSIEKPGEAILDYMQNTRYGCAIPLARIDTTSLSDLDTYSDVLIDYKPVGWNPGDPYSQQARYRVNGPLDTSTNCLDNLQRLVDSCDSWLQYSELTGQWRVVINKLYDGYPDPSGLFLVDSSNLVGGIEISPIDLNETYNQIEVAYPNTNIKDQTDYQIIDLFTDYPSVLSYNEAVNRLNVTLPLVNNAVQAKYLAARRIFQSREDLVITFRTDFSGIQVEAGDVIRVTHETYGWTDKLFRVNSVAEEKDAEGNLFAVMQAFEYNDTVYADDPVQDFVPAFNTGLLDPNVIDFPGAPTIANSTAANGLITSFDVTSYVPETGLVLYMDFNYGNTSNVQQHLLYRTLQQSNGDAYINSSNVGSNSAVYNNVNVNINDLPAGNYYFSVTARNNTSGKRSNSSAIFNWAGANINTPNVITTCNASSNGNVITANAISNLQVNANVYMSSGNGLLDANTYVTSVSNSTTFTVTPNPLVPLSNACITLVSGGITGNQIQPNTITYVNISYDAGALFLLGRSAYSVADIGFSVTVPEDITDGNLNNVPVYIDGINVDPSYYFPYFQNTASTANGYFANSTAVWQPSGAAGVVLINGDDDWWVYQVVNFSSEPGYPLAFNEFMTIKFRTTMIANADTYVQILPFYRLANTPGNFSDTQLMVTEIIPANVPVVTFYEGTYEPTGNLTNGYDTAGMFIKNLVGNTRVNIMYSDLQIYKGKGV